MSIGNLAFFNTDITGTLVIPANVKTIGINAFRETKLTSLDLSQAASLVTIGIHAFEETNITGPIVTPFNVPTYAANTFPSGVNIVKGSSHPSPSPPLIKPNDFLPWPSPPPKPPPSFSKPMPPPSPSTSQLPCVDKDAKFCQLKVITEVDQIQKCKTQKFIATCRLTCGYCAATP